MIKKAQPSDLRAAARLVQILHVCHPLDEVEEDMGHWLSQDDRAVFLALSETQQVVGVALCSLQENDVAGASFYPAAQLDGIYVIEEERGKGYGSALLRRCEEWAGEQGCLQFCAQCDLSDSQRLVFFLKNRLEEASRTIHLVKAL